MGIETILIVLGIIAVVAVVVAVTKSKRKIMDQPPPDTGPSRGGVRPPSDTDRR